MRLEELRLKTPPKYRNKTILVKDIIRGEGPYKDYINDSKTKNLIKKIQAKQAVGRLDVDDLEEMKIKDPKQFKKLQKIFGIKNQKYILWDGHHRLTAYEFLKVKEVPAKIRY